MILISKYAILIIDKYQSKYKRTILGNIECNFYPTCSEYTKICISRFGLINGIILGYKRIKRCSNKYLVNRITDNPPEKI